MISLGINSFFEHPSVALVSDGRLVFAIEDERLTGIKHGKKYAPYRTYIPFDSIYAAFRSTGVRVSDLDEIAYSYSRWTHLRSLWGCFTGRRQSSLREEMTAFLSLTNIALAFRVGYEIPQRYRHILSPAELGRIPYREWDHHLCHAASAFFCSGFADALVVVSDGSGENACTSTYVGRDRELRLVDQVVLPNSLGLFYTYVTKHLGFEPFSDENKVMGLAAYGEPRFEKEFAEVVQLDDRGGYRVDAGKMRNLAAVLGPPRRPDAPLEQVHRDIARSAQLRLEAALERIVAYHVRSTGLNRLCLAGGTFLNCVANGHLARLGLVEEIFVQPASHDAGTAIGAAALSWVRRGGAPQLVYDSMFLGTSYDDAAIEAVLRQARVRSVRLEPALLVERVAERLAGEQIGAVFRGRMEFGPRALGMRSILASPRDPDMRQRLNLLKGREQFRPVAPLVPRDAFVDYFDGYPSRYMLFAVKVRESAQQLIPAAVHVDGTARTQIVGAEDDRFLYDLLQAFGRRTGVPVLINTSFNVLGKPIAESPREALACFATSGLDFLVIGSFLVERGAQ